MTTEPRQPEQPQGAAVPESEREVKEKVNGIDTQALFDAIDDIKEDPSKAHCQFFATTHWKKGAVTDTKIDHYELGGEDIPMDFTITVDEREELVGTNTAPNPQMILYAALNTCVLNTFVVNASARGIRLESVEIDTRGELDLRGFLGIDENVNPGYEELTFVCRVKADASEEQLRECLEAGTRYSPNFQSISKAVKINYDLEIQ